jgi:hypothetical protein
MTSMTNDEASTNKDGSIYHIDDFFLGVVECDSVSSRTVRCLCVCVVCVCLCDVSVSFFYVYGYVCRERERERV